MDFTARPPSNDEDLLRVLRSLRWDRKMPPWVNLRYLYADVPDVVTHGCKSAADGDGRSPVYYILTGLLSKGGGTSRTAGSGFWKVDKTSTVWPSAGEGSSSSGAPLGTVAALAFFIRAPDGAELRNGWLMKEGVAHHAPGEPARYALCKIYKKRVSKKAAAALAAASPFLAASAASRTPAKSRGPASPSPAAAAALLVAAASPFVAASRPQERPETPRSIPDKSPAPAAAAASPFPAASRPQERSEIPLGTPDKTPRTASPAPGSPPSAPATSRCSRWLLLQLEGSNSPPKLGHQVTLKRVLQFLPLDDEQLEQGEIEEGIDERKKRAKLASDLASLMLRAEDIHGLT